MLFFFVIFLVSVVNIDADALQILPIHHFTSTIRTIEVVERNESISSGATAFRVSLDLRREHNTELRKNFAKQPLINVFRQITNENLSANFLRAFVLACFVDFDRFVEQFYHMKDFNRIVCIFFCLELNKAIALMLVGDFVARYVDIDDWAGLEEKLPKNFFIHAGLEITHIDCSLLIPLKKQSSETRQ